jgi:hypothetical protein
MDWDSTEIKKTAQLYIFFYKIQHLPCLKIRSTFTKSTKVNNYYSMDLHLLTLMRYAAGTGDLLKIEEHSMGCNITIDTIACEISRNDYPIGGIVTPNGMLADCAERTLRMYECLRIPNTRMTCVDVVPWFRNVMDKRTTIIHGIKLCLVESATVCYTYTINNWSAIIAGDRAISAPNGKTRIYICDTREKYTKKTIHHMHDAIVQWEDIKRDHWRVADPITAFGLRMSIPFVMPFGSGSPQFGEELTLNETTVLCAHVLSMVTLDRIDAI